MHERKLPGLILVPRPRAARLRLFVAGLFALPLLLVMRGAMADVDNNAAKIDRYNQEISKNYDFKFGPNPFAPSNARLAMPRHAPKRSEPSFP